MAEFFGFLKMFIGCGALVFVVMLLLLALPQSRLRCVGLEMTKWLMAVGLICLVPSPVDTVPDVIPALGWIDDLLYIVGAIASAKSALGDRKKRKLYEEIELRELEAQAKE